MNTIENLRRTRAGTWDQAKAFLDERRGEDGLISAEDTASYEKMEADVVALGHEIERLERQEVMDRELNRPTSAPLTNRPDTLDPAEDKPGAGSRAYAEAFLRILTRFGRESDDIRAPVLARDGQQTR